MLPTRSKQSWIASTVLCKSSERTASPSTVVQIETKKEAKAVILSHLPRAEFTKPRSVVLRRNGSQQWTVVWLFNPKRCSPTTVTDRTLENRKNKFDRKRELRKRRRLLKKSLGNASSKLWTLTIEVCSWRPIRTTREINSRIQLPIWWWAACKAPSNLALQSWNVISHLQSGCTTGLTERKTTPCRPWTKGLIILKLEVVWHALSTPSSLRLLWCASSKINLSLRNVWALPLRLSRVFQSRRSLMTTKTTRWFKT